MFSRRALALIGLLAVLVSTFTATRALAQPSPPDPHGVMAAATPTSTDLMALARQQDAANYQYTLNQGGQILPTSDGRSFSVLWKPPGFDTAARRPVIVTLHGHASFATSEFKVWHPYAVQRGYAIVALQWWFGGGEAMSDYYLPAEIVPIVRAILKEQGIGRRAALFHGFSRGSANSYAVTLLDAQSGSHYFGLTVSNSGALRTEYPPNADIFNGRFGSAPFAGTRWVMYCGEKDTSVEGDGCGPQGQSRDLVQQHGGTVDKFIQDPNGDHGGFHLNAANVNAALDVFDALPAYSHVFLPLIVRDQVSSASAVPSPTPDGATATPTARPPSTATPRPSTTPATPTPAAATPTRAPATPMATITATGTSPPSATPPATATLVPSATTTPTASATSSATATATASPTPTATLSPDEQRWKPYFTIEATRGLTFTRDSGLRISGSGVGVPRVMILPDGTYQMLYADGGFGLRRATSVDGTTWVTHTQVVLSVIPDVGVIYTSDQKYRLIFPEGATGSAGTLGSQVLKSAVSTNGITFTPESGTRFTPPASDGGIIGVPHAAKLPDGRWRLYYVGDWFGNGGSVPKNNVRTAVSSDEGLTWTAESDGSTSNPEGTIDPDVVYLSNGSYRWYFKSYNTMKGIDTASGITSLSTFTGTARLALDGTNIFDPSLLRLPDGTIKMYFGVQGGGIGSATARD